MPVRRVLVEEQEIDPWAIVLLRPGGLPITTSGKVQRSLCKQQYLGGELKVLHEWINPAQRLKANAKNADAADRPAPGRKHNFPSLAGGYDRVRERVEAWLMNWLVDRAGVPRDEISRDKPFAEYGLDSLTAVELSHDLEDWLNLELTPVLAWNYPTPARLAEYLARAASAKPKATGGGRLFGWLAKRGGIRPPSGRSRSDERRRRSAATRPSRNDADAADEGVLGTEYSVLLARRSRSIRTIQYGSSMSDLSTRLGNLSPAKQRLFAEMLAQAPQAAEPIAIVGMACRFPGARISRASGG